MTSCPQTRQNHFSGHVKDQKELNGELKLQLQMTTWTLTDLGRTGLVADRILLVFTLLVAALMVLIASH